MRRLACCCLGIALIPAALQAGHLYGSVIATGKGVSRAKIEINCSGAVTTGQTTADGSYRINVVQQGQCNFTLPDYTGRPSAVVFSYPNPAQYDFELASQNGRYQLRRR